MIENPNIHILEAAAVRLGTMTEKIVFVGGSATGLLLTDPAASPVRATLDVDVIVEVATLARYHWLSNQLRQLGFIEDTSEEAPICRWIADDLIMEDIVTVLDGRPEIVSEVQQASKELKSHLVLCCSGLLKERDFLDALPGHLLPDAASQDRSALVIDRLKAIAGS